MLRSSDLTRAWRTAEAIGEVLAVTPVADRRLRENSYGEAEGTPRAWWDDRLDDEAEVRGVEPRSAFARRVYAAMDAIVADDGRDVVVVTHGYAVTFVIAAWIGMPLDAVGQVNVRVTPGSITTLREDDVFHHRQVFVLGASSHLAR